RSERVHAVDPPLLEDLCEPLPPPQERDGVMLDLRRLTRGLGTMHRTPQWRNGVSLVLRSLTRGLGSRHRTALWLRFGLGLSTKEVARRLGYCPASVRKLSSRALTRLPRWATSDPEGDSSP